MPESSSPISHYQIYFLKIYLFYLFIFVCIGSSLWCAGFSSRWPLLLQSTGCRHTGFSSCGSRAPERRLGSCGARAQLLRGMWDPPGPGLEPVSPASAGRFSTTAPPGKPSKSIFFFNILCFIISRKVKRTRNAKKDLCSV